MTMTRQDFEFIAQTLRGIRYPEDKPSAHKKWQDICNRFAEELYHTNPRFDRTKFLLACGFTIQEVR